MGMESSYGDVSPEKKKHNFLKGCTLKANQDMPFLGVEKGDIIQLNFNGDGTLSTFHKNKK